MFTSRAEHRLALRIDNADLRLTPIARDAGLVDDERWAVFEARRGRLERNRLQTTRTAVVIGEAKISAESALARPNVSMAEVTSQGLVLEVDRARPEIDTATLEAELKYRGYLRQQATQLARVRAEDERAIPMQFQYRDIPGLSREVVQRLTEVRPSTLGQAGRIPGVTPAAVAIIAARVGRLKRSLTPPLAE
jgi:tRNA uridine 5-carboxymethylaminomethyl modification enzyme